MNFDEESLKLHAKHKGKLSISSKVSLETTEDLSLAYTPGVGAVSSAIATDASAEKTLLRTYTMKANSVAIVTDGSAVLGLGNLGPEAALPVMEGKAILFKEFAGIDAFPLCLATQDTEEIIATIKNIAPTFGGINLEDIAAPRCFEIERRLKEELDIPVMHDDQHGTAVVVLAALINALKIKALDKETAKIVINGAGAAGTAISEMLFASGIKNIIICDSKGIISNSRDDLSSAKVHLAEITNPENKQGQLADALQKADVFIGVSKAGALSPELIKTMSPQPVVFALANPNPEIFPDEAKATGAYIVATGRSDFPNQINNVLAFPGIFRGALDNQIKQITQEMLLRAAQNLADCVAEPTPEQILPSALDRSVAQKIASAII